MEDDTVGIILLISLGVFSVLFLWLLGRNRPRSTPDKDKHLVIEESARYYDGR